MIGKLQKDASPMDQLVIMQDNGTADIANVIDIDHERIFASSSTQDYSVPTSNVTSYVGGRGRIYVVAAPTEYVDDTKRLAQLEISKTLAQITHYKDNVNAEDKKSISLREILSYVTIFILILGLIFK